MRRKGRANDKQINLTRTLHTKCIINTVHKINKSFSFVITINTESNKNQHKLVKKVGMAKQAAL